MANDNKPKSALPPYRVLDLTEGGCMLGGKMLGDLGADVIKIEAPGGSLSRIAPYYHNIADPQKSLFWFAYNANKRGITLDLAAVEGQALFKKLAAAADVILESFETGYLGALKLGYSDLCEIKPDIIYASITPFGQKGPKLSYKGSDLTAWASGGYLYTCGNPERAPVWISFPQAGFFGGAEAAIGAMAAMWYRLNTGLGQQVDVSLQECSVAPTLHVLQMWDVAKVEFHRNGGNMYVASTGVRQPIYFKCRDGYAMILVQGGNEPFVTSSKKLVLWMQEEGLAPEWLQKLDWRVDYNAATMGQEIADRAEKAIEKFTLTKTKAELLVEGSIKRGIFIAPVNNTKDISEDRQLEARVYWRKVEHPELNAALTYCGPSVRLSETPIIYQRRAPLIGEHNPDIYSSELGLSQPELASLREKRII
jgi:benzylsuccinate CoA-transferase BbsE subunit